MAQQAQKENQFQAELEALPFPDSVLAIDAKLAENPMDTKLWMERGIAFKKEQMNLRMAIESYSIGLTYDPFCMLLYRHRGHAYINIRRYREGAADLEMASRMDPYNWDNWYHLALAYHLMGEYERALPVYERCLEISLNDDSIVAATDWYCLTLMKLGRLEDAKKASMRVHKGMNITGSGGSYFNRVLVYNGTCTVDEVYDMALKKDNHMLSTSIYGLAVYCEQVLGDYKKGAAIREKVKEKSSLWSGFAELAVYEDAKSR